MSLPHPPKAQDDHDSNVSSVEQISSVEPGKSEAKSEDQSLSVTFAGGIRAPSPAPSFLSIDDANIVRLGRNPNYLPLSDGRRGHASRSPAPPRGWKGKLWASWYKNKGLALVLISQIFGTLMNVTTRILEREGNNGRLCDNVVNAP
jgi:hypothetical protein